MVERMSSRGSISLYLCYALVIWIIISVSTFRNGSTVETQSIRKNTSSSSSDINSRSNTDKKMRYLELKQNKYSGWTHPYGHSIQKSLYSDDKYIIESDGVLPKYKSNGYRVLTVYYASWCGHCRHFATIFKQIAAQRPYTKSNIIYVAVDCAHYESECTDRKIKFYPTVRGYGFINTDGSIDNDKDKESKELKSKESDVLKYIDSHPNNVITSSSTSSSLKLPVESLGFKTTIDYKWGNNTIKKNDKMFRAPQSARMLDAMTSVSFMLTREPASENAYLSGGASVAGKSLKQFLLTVITMILDFRKEDAIPYQKLVKAMQIEWNKSEDSRKSWDTLLRELGFEQKSHPHRSYGPCVGQLNYQEVQAEEEERERIRQSSQNGVVVGDKNVIENEMYYHADRAYTCGLWQLFHFLIAFHKSDTYNIMNVIHNFVEHLFGCDGCRAHFLESWDKCHFGRCDVHQAAEKISQTQTSNRMLSKIIERPEVIQVRQQAMLWLFNLHNNVTKRVAIDHGYLPEQAASLFTFPQLFVHTLHKQSSVSDHRKINILNQLYSWR